MEIKYKVLPVEEYEDMYDDACELVKVKNKKEEEQIGDMVGDLQVNIEEKLKARWRDEDDWAVTYDFNIQYYTFGAIYSEEVFSKEYIELVIQAINMMDEPEIWAYHTVCEIEVNPDGKNFEECCEDRGEFFIKNSTVYIPENMKKEYREMLGCPY